MKPLMVLTSHNQLGNTCRETGFWLNDASAATVVSVRRVFF